MDFFMFISICVNDTILWEKYNAYNTIILKGMEAILLIMDGNEWIVK